MNRKVPPTPLESLLGSSCGSLVRICRALLLHIPCASCQGNSKNKKEAVIHMHNPSLAGRQCVSDADTHFNGYAVQARPFRLRHCIPSILKPFDIENFSCVKMLLGILIYMQLLRPLQEIIWHL